MLRVQPAEPAAASGPTARPELWIGYALRRDMWGLGLATEVATALVDAGRELGLAVHADADVDHHASQRVLVKAGLEPRGEACKDGRRYAYFCRPAPG